MSTRRPGKDWQRTLWESASALSLAAIAAVAVVAAALVLVAGNAAVPAVIRVTVGQQNDGAVRADQYNPASIGISQGDTIRWEWSGGVHDVTSFAETAPGTPEWQSSLMTAAGQSYERQFSSPGTFTYYCSIHAFAQDASPAVVDQNIAAGEMVGKVVVASPAAPTPSPSPSPSPSPAPAGSPSPTPDSSSTPAVTPSPTQSPTGEASPTPPPSATPSPTPAPSETPAPTASPAPTDPPLPTTTPAPSETPAPAAPSAPPPPVATAAPAPARAPTPPAKAPTITSSPTPVAVPFAALASPAPAPVEGKGSLVASAEAGAPLSFSQTGPASPKDGGAISDLFRILTLSLTGLLIAIVIGGFIWIERSQGDQPR